MKKYSKKEILHRFEVPSLKQIFLGLLVSAGIFLISKSFLSQIIGYVSYLINQNFYLIGIYLIISIPVYFSVIKFEKADLKKGYLIGIVIVILGLLINLLRL